MWRWRLGASYTATTFVDLAGLNFTLQIAGGATFAKMENFGSHTTVGQDTQQNVNAYGRSGHNGPFRPQRRCVALDETRSHPD